MTRPIAATINIPINIPEPRDPWHRKHLAEEEEERRTTVAAEVPTERFIREVLGGNPRLKHVSRQSLTVVDGRHTMRPSSLLFQTLHDAYDLHRSVSLAPEVIWYTIMHEVAVTVRKNPAKYAHLFTTTPDSKQEIVVEIPGAPWDDDGHWIQMFDPALRERVPDGIMDHTILRFSTSTVESDVATLVAFMDAASPYYEYTMHTMCGIPSVRLEGKPGDWSLIALKAMVLSEVFATDLGLYFQHLLPVLDRLAAAARGEDVGLDFWRSMVKVDGGSGGPYVSGWITTLWNYVSDQKGGMNPKREGLYDWQGGGHHGLNPDAFTSHVSSVPFKWVWEDGSEHPMSFFGGILGVEKDGDYFCPRLGWAVGERA